MTTTSQQVKAAREPLGWSQAELATKAGMTLIAIQVLESKGRRSHDRRGRPTLGNSNCRARRRDAGVRLAGLNALVAAIWPSEPFHYFAVFGDSRGREPPQALRLGPRGLGGLAARLDSAGRPSYHRASREAFDPSFLRGQGRRRPSPAQAARFRFDSLHRLAIIAPAPTSAP
jgi:hypothetical protein